MAKAKTESVTVPVTVSSPISMYRLERVKHNHVLIETIIENGQVVQEIYSEVNPLPIILDAAMRKLVSDAQ